MTQDEIIDKDFVLQMARQAEKYADLQVSDTDMDIWERTVYLQFAKLVADVATAKEREACAKACEELAELNRTSDTDSMWEWGECAAAIRARGNV